MAALTSEQVRTYEDDGYVVPAYRVPEERMAVLSAAMEEVIAANSDTRPRAASEHPHHETGPAPISRATRPSSTSPWMKPCSISSPA